MKFTLEDWEFCALWTFTFPDAVPAPEIFRRWRAIYAAMSPTSARLGGHWDKPIWRGLRVWEWHPGGHGIHVHVATPDFQDITKVRRACWKNDGRHQPDSDDPRALCGRIHVEPFNPADAGEYLAKYLVKQKGKFPKGMRQWSFFRMEEKHRCKDITYDTPLTRLAAWFKLHQCWREVSQLLELNLNPENNWHRLLICKRFIQDRHYEDKMPYCEKAAQARRVREVMGRDKPLFLYTRRPKPPEEPF